MQVWGLFQAPFSYLHQANLIKNREVGQGHGRGQYRGQDKGQYRDQCQSFVAPLHYTRLTSSEVET